MAVKLLGSLTTSAELSVEDNLYLTDAGTVRGKIELNATDRDDVDIKATSLGSNMKFFTVDTERMRINDYGAVLIGTSNTNGGKADFAVGSPQISWYSGQIQIGGTDMNWNAKGYVDSGIFNLAAWDGNIRLFTQGGSTATSKDIILSPQATGGTTTERVRLKGDTGNFGIGTNAPLEKLHVVGKINSSNNIVSNSTYTMFTGRSSRTVDDYGGLNKEYFKANLVTPGPNTTGESSAHGFADLRFQLANSAGNTNMSDIMTLRSGGNVGIGTTTPGYKLDVSGSFGAKDGSSAIAFNEYSDGATIWLDGSNGDFAGGDYFNISAYGTTDLAFGYGASTKITMKSDGKLGVGTTAPSYGLDVNHNAARIGSSAQTTTSLYLTATNTAGAPAVATQIIMQGYEGRAKGTFYTDSGNDGEWFNGIPYNGSHNYWQVGFDETGGQAEYQANAKLTIRDNGNVGIGTNSPAQKLHVVGDQVRLDTAAGGYYLRNTSGTFRGAFHDNGTVTSIYADGNGSTPAISIESDNSTFAGDITATHADSPTVKLIDTTNDLQARFRVANSYAYLSVDNPGSVNSSRLVFQVDGDEALHLDSSQNAIFAGKIVPSAHIELPYGGELRTLDSGGTVRTIARASSNKLQYGWSYAGAVEFMGGGSYTPRITINTDGSTTFAGDVTTGGDINVPEYVVHDGDTNTHIRFTADRIRLVAGGTTKFDSNSTYVVDSAPAAPTNLSLSVVNDTVNVTFTASATSGIDSYFVFSSVAGGDYSLISMIAPDDFGATMSIIDNAFDATGTQAYRVYAIKNGIISADLTGSISYSVTSPLEPTNMSVVNLNTAFYVQWDAPSANARFVTAYNVYKHEHATESSLDRDSATLIYSGNNYSYMYQISGGDNNNFHKFWVETTVV